MLKRPGLRVRRAPAPAMPRQMSVASQTAQVMTTGSTWMRFKPTRSTYAFCAPIAMIIEPERNKPLRNAGSMA
jgi:hypothetical protein